MRTVTFNSTIVRHPVHVSVFLFGTKVSTVTLPKAANLSGHLQLWVQVFSWSRFTLNYARSYIDLSWNLKVDPFVGKHNLKQTVDICGIIVMQPGAG